MSASKLLLPDLKAISRDIQPVLARMETARHAALARRKTVLIIAIAIAGLAWLIAFGFNSSRSNALIPALVIGILGSAIAFIIFSLIGGSAKKRYCLQYKREVVVAAVRVAVPGMNYDPTAGIAKSEFEYGKLFNSRIDNYSGEDLFFGKVGATDMKFSELEVERIDTSTDSNGKTTRKRVTVFKGIYLIADFHKDFTGRVTIEPDMAEATFGWLGRKMQGLSKGLVRLENPEFEQAFKVTSSDPVAARYLLTPDMQERFLALRNEWSNSLRAGLIDSSLHLAIPNREDWFEPRIDLPASDLSALHNLLSQIISVLKITETLDLNTRLWTKE